MEQDRRGKKWQRSVDKKEATTLGRRSDLEKKNTSKESKKKTSKPTTVQGGGEKKKRTSPERRGSTEGGCRGVKGGTCKEKTD